ncbi:K02A2.6-like, partial [Cordylochernes scorpioides]
MVTPASQQPEDEDEPEEWTKLLSATNPAETLTFLEYVALDEGLEICGSPELEEKKKEEEETEDDEVKEEIMMPTREEFLSRNIFKMASFGKLENFDLSKPEGWIAYLERINFYFVANGIEKIEQNKSILLTLIGPETFSLARSLAAPKPLNDIDYSELIKLLTGHFCPKPNVIVQRYHFNKRNQGTESVSAYVAELRKLSENCEFIDLDDRLRNRLVCGLRNEFLVKRLLSEKDLTFEKAVNLALCDESASADASILQEKMPELNVISKLNKFESPMFKPNKVNSNSLKKKCKQTGLHSLQGQPLAKNSGSMYSILNKETYLKYWKMTQLSKSDVSLRTWASDKVKILGKLNVMAKVANCTKSMTILVADGLGPNILGRQWFGAFHLKINFLNINGSNPISPEFEELFKEEINAYNGPLIHIDLPENAVPKFVKARAVPFALRELVDKKLKSLEEQGIIEPIKFSKWASTIVTVLKNDGTIRICHDYKTTVNLYTNPDKYPLPTIPQLLDRLRGGKIQPPETFDFSTPNEWPKWRKRFERYLVVSGMKKKEEADKIDLFMYLMGDRADDIFRTFKFEKEEEATKIDSVLKAFDSHFCVRKNIIYERAKFNSRIQEDREPVDEFITSLYKLADSCEFEGLHEQLIRDRIVVGVRDKALSERMQLDSELTLEKAVKMVRQQEAVRQQQVDLQRPSTSQKVNQVKFNSKKQSPKQQQQPSRKKEKSAKTRSRCPKCGGFTHREGQACRAEGQKCNLCSKTGHFANCCPDKQAKTAEVKAVSELDEEIGFLLEVSAVEDSSNLDDDEGECRRRWTAEIQVNGKKVKFKLDSQADVTCVPLCLFKKIMGQQRLVESDINIRAAEFSELQTVGMFISTLRNGNYEIKEKIYVIRRLSEPLLSRRACELLNLARRIEVVATRINPIKEFPEVFEGLGQIGNPYEIKLKPGAKPYAVHTPRRVPIPLMEKLKTRLEELEKAGIIAQVNVATEWCAPTVIAGKPNGDIRLCVDLSRLNEHVQREVHPMPVVEHMLGQLGEARFFSKLDANSGFHQIPLSPDCQHLTTFITPFGRYKYCRMPFGISLAPEYFQRVMSIILQGMDGVMCYLDDILIFASDSKTHDRILRLVLRKLKEAKVTLNKAKCVFGVPRINFLGHILDEDGIRPDPAKIEAVAEMPAPTDVHGVRRFLGMVNHLGRKRRTTLPIAPGNLNPKLVDSQTLKRKEGRRRKDMKSRYDRRCGATDMEELSEGDTVWITDMRTWGIVKQKASTPRSYMVDTPVGTLRRNRFHLRKGVTVQYPADPSTPTFSGEELVENEKTPVVDYPSNDSEDGQIRTRNSNNPWKWNREHQRAFKEAKSLISSESVLAHFDDNLPILVSCDASEYGIGAILSQVDHGVERPVVFASRTLNKTERRYAVIDREALAVIFAVSKFYQYLLGRKFKILTDHKPLIGLFNPSKPIPQVLSPRMLRWCLTLSAYSYSIEYKPGRTNGNVDALSRLPLNESPSEVPNPPEVFFIESENAAVSSSEVAKLTSKDPILSRIKFWAMNGWPEQRYEEKFKDFSNRSSEISVHKDCLLWGSRVIIPEKLRRDILNLLHDTHVGIVGTKALARGLGWWPNMDKDIERLVSNIVESVCLVVMIHQRLVYTPGFGLPDLEIVSGERNKQEEKFMRTWRPHRAVEEGQEIVARNYHGPKWLPGVVCEKTGPVSVKVETDDGRVINRHLDQVRSCGENESLPSTSSTLQVPPESEETQDAPAIESPAVTPQPVLR